MHMDYSVAISLQEEKKEKFAFEQNDFFPFK